MDSRPAFSRRLVAVSALLLGAAPTARAQHLLVVVDGNKPEIVVAAQGTRPQVLEDGKLRTINASRFALVDCGEYLPLYVAVRHIQVKTSSAMFSDGTGDINKEFHLNGELETAFSLENVFVVLTVKNDHGENGLFLFEIGRLEPREPRQLDLAVPMSMDNAPGRFELYLFSGGRELFQSWMPIGAAEAALDRMVFDRIREVKNAPPQPFVGPAPEYPRELLRKKVAGSASVRFDLDARGRVLDPVVVSASQPEFGEAALAAIKDWRFLPKVRNGRPVETKAEMPFNFGSPAPK